MVIMKVMIKTVLGILSIYASIGYASTIENLVLVCRGGMELHQISELTNSVETNILEQLTSSNDNSISQQDIIKLVKGKVSQSNNNTDTHAFYLCIESMASSILSNKTEISGKTIQIKSSNSDGLVKTPIQISKSNKTRMVFQYAREEQGQYVIALRLINDFNARAHKFYFKKNSAQLVGEDSGEEYKLESISGAYSGPS